MKNGISCLPITRLLALLLASAVSAQGTTWSSLASTANPPPRTYQAMAYDAARQEVVLFGGSVSGCVNDTWTWNGTSWTQRTPVVSPVGCNGHAMAYDRQRGVVVLFGGNQCGGYLNDTWEWDGTTWQQVFSATQPPGRTSHGFVYHEATGTCVMFGGWNGSRFNDTWEWDGVNWQQRQPATSPPNTLSLPGEAMAYDSARERSVIAIYYPSTGIETWEWDGVDWSLAHSGLMLPGSYQIAYDRGRGRTVLMGGSNSYTVAYGHTYEWDGTVWSQAMPITTIDRGLHSMVFDEARDQLVTFGGFSDLWPNTVLATGTYAYESLNPSTWASYGAGCPGSLGNLELAAAESRPWLGDTFSVEVGNLPVGSVPLLITGHAPSQQPLSGLGIPGCTLLVVDENIFLMTHSGSTASWSLAVPTTTSLIGMQFFLQSAAVLAGGNNPLGAALSPGLRGTVGAR
tara:strand:- start:100874 stop:102244 length:1371 start_codon:yes stop_codon:yes gene_type:complete